MGDPIFDSYMGRGPKKIAHWEHWSNPDAETYLTGIDYFEHPRLCRLRLNELYPELRLPVPATDTPVPEPDASVSADHEAATVRWGDRQSATWVHGEAFFPDPESVFSFSPLEHADFRGWPHVIECADMTSEDAVYARYRPLLPANREKAPEGSPDYVWYYNTMFMWPLLTFGWENFIICSLDDRFARIMEEFREINRRVFRAFARLPVNFILCHDDIVTTRGPSFSPEWMRRYIFPAYEEFWGIVRASGKEVLFMADGCMDAHVDDIMALGARGIISEPYTDYRRIARKYKDCFIAGEGDNRILSGGDKNDIRKMVMKMAETGRMSGGYMMCVGNHIPWNVPGESVKLYLEYSRELAIR